MLAAKFSAFQKWARLSGIIPVSISQQWAGDSSFDPLSPWTTIYEPDATSRADFGAPIIAAQVDGTNGRRELWVFDRRTSTLIDTSTTERTFGTDGVALSNNGNHVAFHAFDAAGTAGIYRWDKGTGGIALVASEGSDGVTTIDTSTPDVNGMGLVAFRGTDQNGNSSVFLSDGTTTQRALGEGDLIDTDLGPRELGRSDGAGAGQIGAPRINDRGDLLAMFDYFDPLNPSTASDGEVAIMLPVELRPIDADFNDDGSVDCADIDALTTDLAFGGIDVQTFDLNGDGSVDRKDLDQWLFDAGELNVGPRRSYLPGDANLDGFVDISDFNVWNENKFTNNPHWCSGDMNADGSVDVSDFGIWNGNKFTGSLVAVPEPTCSGVLLMLAGIFAVCKSRR